MTTRKAWKLAHRYARYWNNLHCTSYSAARGIASMHPPLHPKVEALVEPAKECVTWEYWEKELVEEWKLDLRFRARDRLNS
jgi:hypothetical protein